MKAIKYFTCFLFLLSFTKILPQDQKILVFDPNGISSAFQYSFSQLSDDSIFIADTIDNEIFNYDALFLFIDYPYILARNEGERLIQYTSQGMPVYLSSYLIFQPLDSTSFWNHIGINDWVCLLTEVHVDTFLGVDSSFTSEIVIDTGFISG